MRDPFLFFLLFVTTSYLCSFPDKNQIDEPLLSKSQRHSWSRSLCAGNLVVVAECPMVVTGWPIAVLGVPIVVGEGQIVIEGGPIMVVGGPIMDAGCLVFLLACSNQFLYLFLPR